MTVRESGDTPYLSVVAPLYNESENVGPLIEWILEALRQYPRSFEVVLVDDGSRDDTWARVVSGA
jgi:glycosyltransferase involved in cell wall biosynthesis